MNEIIAAILGAGISVVAMLAMGAGKKRESYVVEIFRRTVKDRKRGASYQLLTHMAEGIRACGDNPIMVNEKLEGEEKDWLIKDLREKLNEREKATATLTYLKYKKMRDEMQKLKMHGGPDDYLENLEKIKKEAGIDNLYKSYEDKKSLDRIKKHPEEVIKLK